MISSTGIPPTTDPWSIGRDHELASSPADRNRRGAWYTPRAVVEHLVALAIEPSSIPSFVVDPTCGGGAFLLGVLDRLVAVGLEPREALGRVGGVDIDPGAVAVARRAVGLWADHRGVGEGAVERVRLGVGDALDGLDVSWPRPDLIVGNPPFSTPLRGREHPVSAAEFRRSHEQILGPYADLAAIHLAADLTMVQPAGRVCVVLPQSLLASRDVAGLRAELAGTVGLVHVWVAREAVFDAGVRVWAPLFDLGSRPDHGLVGLSRGADPQLVPEAVELGRDGLADVVAVALGAPAVRLDRLVTHGSLGSMVRATAGFRDEYYGLAHACVEGEVDDPRPRVVTVGALDPLTHSWGQAPMKFAKQTWSRPVIERSRLDGRVGRWVEQQARPKVVLPTQSKVFEPVVDRDGSLVPVTPVLSIHAEPDDLNAVAAVLLAPPVVVWAYRRWFGTALSVDAIKLAARDLADVPLPADTGAWVEAAFLVEQAEGVGPHRRREILLEIGRLMNMAYGAPGDCLQWWIDRLGTR